jgi:hypothetical protein
VTLYDIIADLRREHPNEGAARTLDMVMVELGQTRDNLRQALANLDGKPLPPGGKEILDELETRARMNRLDNLSYGPPARLRGFRAPLEPVDEGSVGIAVLLGGTALLLMALGAAAVVAGLNSIFHWF